jgi:hypothetical protein
MSHHDPLTAVHLTLERGDPWLALFLIAFVALCGWMACRVRR